MKTIFADFNAMTELEYFRLNCKGSQDDLRDAGARIGDWAWLSDGELIVGAQLAIDDRYGLVGVPAWDTLVHLDEENDQDFDKIRIELRRLLDKTGRSPDEEARVLQLVTLFETFAPPAAKAAVRPGYFPSQRADSLLVLGKPELALLEIEEARRAEPNPDNDHLFLEILRRVDLTRAVREAEALAATSHTCADVLAECINVLATHADNLPDDQFEPVGRRILDWSEQFERVPGRERVRASTLAQLLFNKGLTLLRLGDVTSAKRVIAVGLAVDPILSEIDEATRLTVYDQRARDLAARIRARPTAA
jgi:hypothetical protein